MGYTHEDGPDRRFICLIYKVSLLSPPSFTAMFYGIPPWERRVNKHLSFPAREATSRLKCLNLGARARSPPPFCSFFLSVPSSRGQRDGCPEGDARLRIMKIRMLDPGDGWIRSGTECNGSHGRDFFSMMSMSI